SPARRVGEREKILICRQTALQARRVGPDLREPIARFDRRKCRQLTCESRQTGGDGCPPLLVAARFPWALSRMSSLVRYPSASHTEACDSYRIETAARVAELNAEDWD